MTDKTLEILDRENDELLRAVKYYRTQLTKTVEENKMLRKLLLDRGVKHE